MRYINLNPKRSLSCFFLLFLILFLNISCKNNSSPYADVTLQTLLAPYDKSKLTPVDVVILSGQSNMGGRGNVEEAKNFLSENDYKQVKNGIESIYIFSCNDITKMNQGLAFRSYSKVSFGCSVIDELFGPEVGFALEYQKTKKQLALIKYSVWGESIEYFIDSRDISGLMKAYILACLKELIENGYYPNIRAVCWMQGETDCEDFYSAKYYYTNEKSLIKYLRNDFNNNLLFIDARVTDWQLLNPHCFQNEVNQSKEKISSEDDLCFLIDSTGLKKCFDCAHYDTPSTIELGRRFAREFLAHSEAGK